MQIILNLPEDIARHLETGGTGVPRAALEGLALEGYRSGKLTESQVRRLLEFGTRYEVHGFLKEHGVPLRYSERDLERDTENARKFSEKWSSSRASPHLSQQIVEPPRLHLPGFTTT